MVEVGLQLKQGRVVEKENVFGGDFWEYLFCACVCLWLCRLWLIAYATIKFNIAYATGGQATSEGTK